MKPKCPKCGSTKLSIENGGESSWVVCDCQWQRRVSRAAIIRLGVEPKKPETCKWKDSIRHGFYSISCGMRGIYKGYGAPKFCESCGKRVEVVNG